MLLEGADEVGGTWRDNTYPGIAVDVPSFEYQLSIELNPDWSRVFAPGAELKAYTERVVDRYDLRGRIRFDSRGRAARWDEDARPLARRARGRRVAVRRASWSPRPAR